MHNTNTFTPIHERDLTSEQIKKALDAISVIKEKRDGSVKGRICANGRKQRLWKSKAESASPTAHTDSVFLTSMIDAHEERATAVVDVPGAYLNAEIGEFLILKFVDEQVDAMCKINSKYEKYVIRKGKRRILYLMLNQALYGCVQSALLWY